MDKKYKLASSGLGRKLAAEVSDQTTRAVYVPDVYSGPFRQSGKGYLLDKAYRLEEEARGLRALASAIPDNFPADADAGLWHLASKI